MTLLRSFCVTAGGLAIAAGCSADGLSPTAPRIAVPAFAVAGDRALVGVQSLTYDGGAGTIRAEVAVNRGIYQAAQRSSAGFSLALGLTLSDAGGQQRQIAPSDFPLLDAKLLGVDPAPHSVALEVPLGWDGKDADGKAMAGPITASWKAELVMFPNGERRAVGQGSEGTLPVDGTALSEPALGALVAVFGITYEDGSGLRVELGVNRGIFEAAQHSATGFGVALEFTVQDRSGKARQINPDDLPLDQVLGISPSPHLVALTQLVAWDGTDGAGNALAGPATVSYKAAIVHFPDGRRTPVGQGVSGTATIELPAVQGQALR